jgi:DNA-binding NarL/FixJ family response regulator
MGSGLPVVVADADDASRRAVVELLDRLGFVSFEATDGLEAVSLAGTVRPVLVVLEVALPELTGYEVCRELRERQDDDLRIVFVSGSRTEPLDRIAGLLIGADDYVVKPFDPGELLARLRSLMRPRAGDRRLATPSTKAPGSSELESLTPRELEILALLSQGLDQGEIATRLVISRKTVATHLQRALGKLGVHSRAQAVAVYHRALGSAAPVLAAR